MLLVGSALAANNLLAFSVSPKGVYFCKGVLIRLYRRCNFSQQWVNSVNRLFNGFHFLPVSQFSDRIPVLYIQVFNISSNFGSLFFT